MANLKRLLPIPGVDFKVERLFYYLYRITIRIIVFPFSKLPESEFKNSIRCKVLSLQHSLPIELSVNKGDTVVQIGTPWPRTLHRFRKAIGDAGCLIIVEAEPDNFKHLLSAANSYKYKNVHIIQAAAWSERKVGQFCISPFSGDHKIQQDAVLVDNDLRPGNARMEVIDVQFRTLDELLSKINVHTINYLSVTVNGAELEVLKGAREVLRRSTNIRVYAKGHSLLENKQPLNKQINIFMKSLDYKTKITRGEPSSTTNHTWRWRDGDVFAWKH